MRMYGDPYVRVGLASLVTCTGWLTRRGSAAPAGPPCAAIPTARTPAATAARQRADRIPIPHSPTESRPDRTRGVQPPRGPMLGPAAQGTRCKSGAVPQLSPRSKPHAVATAREGGKAGASVDPG